MLLDIKISYQKILRDSLDLSEWNFRMNSYLPKRKQGMILMTFASLILSNIMPKLYTCFFVCLFFVFF